MMDFYASVGAVAA